MRIPIWLVLVAAVAGGLFILFVGQFLVQPPTSLILRSGFDDDVITPNADGEGDITRFQYALARNALISLVLQHEETGDQFVFREREPRFANEYSVLFSGVVAGYVLPGEQIDGVVERRLIPDGTYRWYLIAENEAEREETTGILRVEEGDVPLPTISIFTVGPSVFTPNQDGIGDRVEVNVYLDQPADLRVLLLDETGREFPISARREGRKPGEAGRHVFDYEGGVDLGADPPPDGTYTIIALAQDAVGQRVRRDSQLTIRDGGKPRAEIMPQATGVDVVFEPHPYEERFFSDLNALGDRVDIPSNPAYLTPRPITMLVGDMLVFRATVQNYSTVPIRTSGPPPGTVYQQDQISASVGAYDESGAWRFGIQCETSTMPFPYRWAIGSEDVLEVVEDVASGNVYYYLPPGGQAVVWGAIRMTIAERRRNPQLCWAGLIHEDVEISIQNRYVGPRQIELVEP